MGARTPKDDATPGSEDPADDTHPSRFPGHDAVFRGVFHDPWHLAGLLRLLDPDLAAELELDGIEVADATLVGADLRARIPDLVFQAHLRGHPTLLLLLFEHQRTRPKRLALRLAVEVIRLHEAWDRAYGTSGPLPAVLPLLVQHGPAALGPVDAYEDLVDPSAKAALGAHLLRLQPRIIRLEGVPDAALHGPSVAERTLWAMERIDDPSVGARGREVTRALVEAKHLPHGEGLGIMLLTYLTVGHPTIDRDDVLEAVRGLPEEPVAMSAAEQWREEGRIQGRAEGEARGRVEGRVEGARRTLVAILGHRFGPLAPEQLARVETLDLEAVERATGRLFSASTVDEVIG